MEAAFILVFTIGDLAKNKDKVINLQPEYDRIVDAYASELLLKARLLFLPVFMQKIHIFIHFPLTYSITMYFELVTQCITSHDSENVTPFKLQERLT